MSITTFFITVKEEVTQMCINRRMDTQNVVTHIFEYHLPIEANETLIMLQYG